MLSKRQQDILQLLQSKETSTTASLAKHFQVGERTIRNDISGINATSLKCGVTIHNGKEGLRLEVLDPKVYAHIQEETMARPKYSFNIPESRYEYILARLLSCRDYVTSEQLEKEMFLSSSTMTQDLAQVRKILQEYSLTLETRPRHGMFLQGDEIQKRRCIIARGIQVSDGVSPLLSFTGIDTDPISHVLTEALLKWEFRVSDIVFQNLVMHLSTSILRLKAGFFLEPSEDLPLIYKHAQDISSEIFHRFTSIYEIPYDNEEVKRLAISLQGKREYDTSDSISVEINDFVFNALMAIKKKFGVDFTADLNFRIGLALHTKPLIARMQIQIQLDNVMTLDIKQKYSYAFDLASEYSYQLTKKYKLRLSDDEIAYLALHFIVGLRKIEQSKANKKILLVSEQRKSNTILIQQQILQWFEEEIRTIELANMVELSKYHLEDYDAILTTNDHALQMIPNAVRINFFPTQADHTKIEMALSGITNSGDILRHFSPDLFITGNITSQKDVIEQLCDKAEMVFPTNGKLLKSVLVHENIANTYFGNEIAIPHPDAPMTRRSFIVVAIPDKPILWDEKQPVSLILLVSIEKDNPSALQIWQYLSYLISDEDLIQAILKTPTYSNFVQVITKFYQDLLGK